MQRDDDNRPANTHAKNPDKRIPRQPNSAYGMLGKYDGLNNTMTSWSTVINGINPANVSGSQDDPKPTSYAQVALCVGQPAVEPMSDATKPNDSRPFRITVRFSISEREILVRQAEKSCLTVSDYIRAAVLGAGYLSAIDPVRQELLKKISRELGYQGNNLNQIAKHLNTGKAPIDEGNSMLAIIARSLLPAHQAVRQALAAGKVMP